MENVFGRKYITENNIKNWKVRFTGTGIDFMSIVKKIGECQNGTV